MQYIAILGGEIEYDGYDINIRNHRGSTDYIPVMDSRNVTNVAVSHDSRENASSYDISFFRRKDKDLNKLMKYAELLRVKNILMPYLQSLI